MSWLQEIRALSKKLKIFKSTGFGLILLLFWFLEALKIYASCTFKCFSVTAGARNGLLGARRMSLSAGAYPRPYPQPARLAGVRDTAPALPGPHGPPACREHGEHLPPAETLSWVWPQARVGLPFSCSVGSAA